MVIVTIVKGTHASEIGPDSSYYRNVVIVSSPDYSYRRALRKLGQGVNAPFLKVSPAAARTNAPFLIHNSSFLEGCFLMR